MTDRRLDRIPLFDPRSRSHPIRHAAGRRPRSFSWRGGPVTDQGREGACVGHGWTGELTARPAVVPIPDPDAYASSLYHVLQHRDPWAGCALGRRCPIEPSVSSYDGTSVLSGAQELKARGLIGGYEWCLNGLPDVILALGYRGPVVLGIAWYESFYEPDKDGVLRIGGQVAGGHCILARGVSLKRQQVLLRNSWGRGYGIDGDVWIGFADLARLLADDGEGVIPTLRVRALAA